VCVGGGCAERLGSSGSGGEVWRREFAVEAPMADDGPLVHTRRNGGAFCRRRVEQWAFSASSRRQRRRGQGARQLRGACGAWPVGGADGARRGHATRATHGEARFPMRAGRALGCGGRARHVLAVQAAGGARTPRRTVAEWRRACARQFLFHLPMFDPLKFKIFKPNSKTFE
jgi:hypothetical protein